MTQAFIVGLLPLKFCKIHSVFGADKVKECLCCKRFFAESFAEGFPLPTCLTPFNVVSRILLYFSAPGDDTKVSPNVLKAFRNGLAAHQNDVAEACEGLRQVCYAAHNQ